MKEFNGTFILAWTYVVGTFTYFVVRGGVDPVIVPIISAGLTLVLSFFFAQHIANGAADKAMALYLAANPKLPQNTGKPV